MLLNLKDPVNLENFVPVLAISSQFFKIYFHKVKLFLLTFLE
jgi:hypothetical protein